MQVINRYLGFMILLVVMGESVPAHARKAKEQLIYVPVYSEVAYGDRGARVNLATTLSIRNLDQGHEIRLSRVDYYNSSGKLVRQLVSSDGQGIPPMAAAEFVIKESDKSGGISASCLVAWSSESTVQAPLVEAVMVNSEYSKGMAFVERGKILEEQK